ncbi:LOW QUALITY PROTEIN: kinesin-like protein KIF2C [Glossophaga mutica]
MSTVSEGRITTQENNMEVELPASTNPCKHFSVPTGPPRNACPAVAEIPFPMVSEEVEEQVHSSQGSSSENPANSVQGSREVLILGKAQDSAQQPERSRVASLDKIQRSSKSDLLTEGLLMRTVHAGGPSVVFCSCLKHEYDNRFPTWEFAMIKEFRATLDCHPLNMTDPVKQHRICVCVRKRLMIKQGKLHSVRKRLWKLSKKEIDLISVPSKCPFVHEPWFKMDLTKYLKNQAFCFDFTLNEIASNEVVYRFTDRPLVHTIFKGGKATCFAYGQRGSEKTREYLVMAGREFAHGAAGGFKKTTMGGSLYGKSQNASKGIYAMASHDIFVLKNQPCYRNLGLEVYVTFFEIYNGALFDLPNKNAKLSVLEDGKQQLLVLVLEHVVSCADDVIRMIDIESAYRTSGQRFANSNSSRSHICFQIFLRAKGRVHGKFPLVDLAGNRRGADPPIADQQTCMEGTEIKTSLLALKECIRALGQNKAQFRQSKLAQVLWDSFILENSRTYMIATISPGISSCECTLNTLRYADRVKELSPHNGPIGEQPVQMEVEQTEASLNGSLTADNFPKEEEEELSSQMSSFNEVMTQIRELEERAVEELKEIIQQGPGWLELSKLTEQPDYDLETFVNKAESALAQQAKHFSALQVGCSWMGYTIKALRLAMQLEEQASKQMSSKKQPR